MMGQQETFRNQFDCQHARAKGRILNVGCDADTSHLKRSRGAVNVDIWDRNPFTGMVCPIDVRADARTLPADLHGRFDTVILGDILEHFVDEEDVLVCLLEAKKCLDPQGAKLIIITCPEDHRPVASQVKETDPHYLPGVKAYHAYPVTREIMECWCKAADLEVIQYDRIAYEFCLPSGGHGIVATPADAGATMNSSEQEPDADGD